MKRFLLSLLASIAVIFVAGAQKAPKQVKLAVEMEQSLEKSLGDFVEGDMVVVNGKVCPVVVTKKGTQYVEADKSDDALYKAAYRVTFEETVGTVDPGCPASPLC